jgi:predicted RNA-binding Zn ribbon-like protein
MGEKKPKISSSEPDVDEVWTAGGPIWINFANTIALASKGMADVTKSSESLNWWLGIMGLSAPNGLEQEDLTFANQLRESFRQVIESIEHGRAISDRDLELFNSVLSKQQTWNELDQLESGVIVTKAFRSNESIEQVLGPAVESLSETLVHGDLNRLRTCAHPDCVLRFYDDSKNGARRWCSMSGCGNRAKAAAYLQRKKIED